MDSRCRCVPVFQSPINFFPEASKFSCHAESTVVNFDADELLSKFLCLQYLNFVFFSGAFFEFENVFVT
jgi:hypothetical protein